MQVGPFRAIEAARVTVRCIGPIIELYCNIVIGSSRHATCKLRLILFIILDRIGKLDDQDGLPRAGAVAPVVRAVFPQLAKDAKCD